MCESYINKYPFTFKCGSCNHALNEGSESEDKFNDVSDSPQTWKQNFAGDVNRGVTAFSKLAALSAAAISTPFSSIAKAEGATEFKLPSLPYKYDELEPYISKNTLFYHHDKHHSKYIATTNALIKDTEYEKLTDLTTILIKSHESSNKALFNNAAQSWNHDFYWKCMKPSKASATNIPTGKLLTAIEDSFGTFDEFKKQVSSIHMYIY